MKRLFLIMVSVICFGLIECRAQWLVYDFQGDITAILNSLEQVAVSTDNLDAALENMDKNSKMLDMAVDNLNRLRTVKKQIKNGTKVIEILSLTIETGNLYAKLFKVLVDGHFSQLAQAKHLANLYSMFCKSTEYVLELEELVTDNLYELSDAERIRFINDLHSKTRRNYSNMSYYGRKIMEDDYYVNAIDNDMKILKNIF